MVPEVGRFLHEWLVILRIEIMFLSASRAQCQIIETNLRVVYEVRFDVVLFDVSIADVRVFFHTEFVVQLMQCGFGQVNLPAKTE